MELSIIVPAFGRVELLRFTLESLQTATSSLSAEIIVVDDGSDVPLEGVLPPPWLTSGRIRCLRQKNSGSPAARWRGWQAARGEFVAFIDSDDLVSPDKYTRQLEALRLTGADIAYTDEDILETTSADPSSCVTRTTRLLPEFEDPLELLLTAHALPHNLLYRRILFERLGPFPWIPLHPLLRPVGDVWTTYLLAPFPAKLVKVDGALTIFRNHAGDRYSAKWELTGIGAALLMHQFIVQCPSSPSSRPAKVRVARNALQSLRALPRGMPPPWEILLQSLWTSVPEQDLGAVGGRFFQTTAAIIGLKRTVHFFRRLQRPRYVAEPRRVPINTLREHARTLGEITGL